ncbi:SprT family zinc-dependent metalloprotease [Neobacillus sp. OS1-33]|uniref:M48 family metallopeptidase n=1 Tax=Neobacillus sp. OS1-33 TaxID=3070683 RepID=UPI0027DF55C0|nr:SprT family zinc-dependent metalloprotease [Neobacillus sp. OS1-33]WML26279.1 SprT family zinc-dependent metalloprotease [Neobacillus sp. OS1-33]
MQNFKYGTTTIDFSIEYKKDKKDVSLSVCLNEGVKLVAPEGIDFDKIKTILHKRAPWILKKKFELEEIVDSPTPKEYISGEKFGYLGRQYTLKVYKNEHLKKPELAFKQGRFIAEIPPKMADEERQTKLSQLFKDWYVTHGNKKVEERLKIYCPKMELEPSKVVLKEQQKRWGTCTKDGAIYLNWRIMMAPMSVVDYVIVHELAHLKYPNHSTDYWNFVRSILPDYNQRKEWLRINGPILLC